MGMERWRWDKDREGERDADRNGNEDGEQDRDDKLMRFLQNLLHSGVQRLWLCGGCKHRKWGWFPDGPAGEWRPPGAAGVTAAQGSG